MTTHSFSDYSIKETWIGFQSYDTNDTPCVFSQSLEDCSYWTERLLKARVSGWEGERVMNEGVVGGKL